MGIVKFPRHLAQAPSHTNIPPRHPDGTIQKFKTVRMVQLNRELGGLFRIVGIHEIA